MSDRLLNLREVTCAVGLGRSAIFVAMKASTSPRQRKASTAKVMWPEL
jgi:predicted DNA-binding transcriptional regulator AlpA